MKFQSKRFKVLSLVLALGLVALACAQSGDILTDAEATERYRPTATPQLDLSATAAFQIGADVTIVGGTAGFLVPLYGEPGARFFSSQINSGETAVVQEHGLDDDGNIWYRVEGQAGTGWLTEDHLIPLASE